MNRSDTKKGLLTALLSVILLIASSAACFVFYYFTRYLPFYLMALAVILPTAVYAVVLLVGLLHRPPEADTEPTTEVAVETDEAETPKKPRFSPRRILVRACHALARFLYERRLWLILLPALAISAVCHLLFWRMIGRMTSVYSVGYAVPVILLLFFILFVIFDRWCKYAETKSEYMAALLLSLRSAFGVVAVVAMTPLITIQLLGFRAIVSEKIAEKRAMKKILSADDQQIINFM